MCTHIKPLPAQGSALVSVLSLTVSLPWLSGRIRTQYNNKDRECLVTASNFKLEPRERNYYLNYLGLQLVTTYPVLFVGRKKLNTKSNPLLSKQHGKVCSYKRWQNVRCPNHQPKGRQRAKYKGKNVPGERKLFHFSRREEGLCPGRHEKWFSFPYKVKSSNSKVEARWKLWGLKSEERGSHMVLAETGKTENPLKWSWQEIRPNKKHGPSFLPPPKHLSHKSWERNLSSLNLVLETRGVCSVCAGLGPLWATNSKHTVHLSSLGLSPVSLRALPPNTIHTLLLLWQAWAGWWDLTYGPSNAWCLCYICWIEVRLEGVSGFTTHHDMGILAYISFMKYDTIPICQSAHLSTYLVCLIYFSYLRFTISINHLLLHII